VEPENSEACGCDHTYYSASPSYESKGLEIEEVTRTADGIETAFTL
jgi:hypothetical protein